MAHHAVHLLYILTEKVCQRCGIAQLAFCLHQLVRLHELVDNKRKRNCL